MQGELGRMPDERLPQEAKDDGGGGTRAHDATAVREHRASIVRRRALTRCPLHLVGV